jgi:hypothetical protein
MKRIARLLALGALLAVTLAACGNDAGNKGPAAAATVPVTADQVEAISANMLAAAGVPEDDRWPCRPRLGRTIGSGWADILRFAAAGWRR